jgi:hypothetical protein
VNEFEGLIFRFSSGGFFEGYETLEISYENDCIYVTYSVTGSFSFDNALSEPYEITQDKLAELESCLANANVDKWYRNYTDPHVLDGTQWELFYHNKKHEGSNKFPDEYDLVTNYLKEHFGCRGW